MFKSIAGEMQGDRNKVGENMRSTGDRMRKGEKGSKEKKAGHQTVRIRIQFIAM